MIKLGRHHGDWKINFVFSKDARSLADELNLQVQLVAQEVGLGRVGEVGIVEVSNLLRLLTELVRRLLVLLLFGEELAKIREGYLNRLLHAGSRGHTDLVSEFVHVVIHPVRPVLVEFLVVDHRLLVEDKLYRFDGQSAFCVIYFHRNGWRLV